MLPLQQPISRPGPAPGETEAPDSTPSDRKRRRVTRACDVCRRKKVKCDGKQPCIHCTVYSYRCAYEEPNVRNRRNPGIPTPSDVNADFASHHRPPAPDFASGFLMLPGTIPHDRLDIGESQASVLSAALAASNSEALQALQVLLPRINVRGGHLDTHKLSKIVNYLRSKNAGIASLGDITDLYLDGPSPLTPPVIFDPPSVSSNEGNPVGREIRLVLPPKATALQLIYTTWNKACVLFRFYHRPSLLEEVEFLYSMDPVNYTGRQQKFLPFLYLILACGLLFSRLNELSKDNDSLEDDGFNYFLEARKLIDITNVGDISQIQTIVMMIMYLQCLARLSTCYLYIGIAMRSALKEGLHRNLLIFQSLKRRLDPIEIDTRKRLFFTIYKMDIYINSLLGLPRSVHEDEFDQEMPEELDDENITRDALNYDAQNGRISSSACANHHTKLMMVMSHVVRDLYPIKVRGLSEKKNRLGVHERVTKLEMELKTWLTNLPAELKPSDPSDDNSGSGVPEKFVLANCYLHLAFLNCQIMLYRPFIHYISNEQTPTSDPKSLIRGRNCIKVARTVVKLANKMIDKDLLVGTYWFSMYTIFFLIACLIYYYHFANYNNLGSNGANYAGVLFDDDLDVDKIKRDIEVGKRVLDCLKNNSNASMRIYRILNNLFEQLNRHTAASKIQKDPLLEGAPGGLYIDSTPKSRETPRDKASTSPLRESTTGPNVARWDNEYSSTSPLSDFQRASEKVHTEIPFGDQSSRFKKGVANEVANQVHLKSVDRLLQDGLDGDVAKVKFEPFDGHQQESAPTNDASDANSDTEMQSSDSVVKNSDPYKPGVFDQLDAQIFGRILPPYMLEKNAPNGQETDPLQLDQQNLGDFSFFGDGAPLDYLDPFNESDEWRPA